MNEFAELTNLKPRPSLTQEFSQIADYLFSSWQINASSGIYEFIEVEFLLHTKCDTHQDPNITLLPSKYSFANWFVADGGLEITFGNDDYAAAIFIRSIKDTATSEIISGPKNCYAALFRDAGNILDPKPNPRMEKKSHANSVSLRSVPRVQIPVEERNSNIDQRLKFAFKPYRFIDISFSNFPEKYLAMLYSDKVCGLKIDIELEQKIYNKYLNYFDKGLSTSSLDAIWRISSRSHRMAALMGFLEKTNPDSLR